MIPINKYLQIQPYSKVFLATANSHSKTYSIFREFSLTRKIMRAFIKVLINKRTLFLCGAQAKSCMIALMVLLGLWLLWRQQ